MEYFKLENFILLQRDLVFKKNRHLIIYKIFKF